MVPMEVRSVGITSVVIPAEAAMKDGRGVIAAAVKGNTAAVGAATMEDCSTAMKAAASMETSTTMEAASTSARATTATAAVPNLGRQSAGC